MVRVLYYLTTRSYINSCNQFDILLDELSCMISICVCGLILIPDTIHLFIGFLNVTSDYIKLLIVKLISGYIRQVIIEFSLFMEPTSCIITHWGRVTHICVSKLTIIGSDNGLLPGRRQAIIWINAGILLIRTLGTNFSEILSEIHAFSFKKMHLKMSSGKRRPSCLGLNMLIGHVTLAAIAGTTKFYQWVLDLQMSFRDLT